MQGPRTIGDIQGRTTTLKQRFEREHRAMRDLDPWRHMDPEELEGVIWQDYPQDHKRETIPSPVIQAVTDSVVALLTAHHPTVTVRARNTLDLPESDKANFNERVGLALFYQLDRKREESILAEMAEHIIHRGKIVLKALFLSAEERGEERTALDPLSPDPDEQALIESGTTERLTEPGEFPVLIVPIDPIECYYTKDKRDEVVEFVHEYWDSNDNVIESHPGIESMDGFEHMTRTLSGNGLCHVIDYWDREINARIVDGKFYLEPKEHNYSQVPFIVQNAKLKHRDARSTGGTASTLHYDMATPFCLPMLEDVKRLSLADSIEWTSLSFTASGAFTLEGIDPQGNSPNWTRYRNDDGTMIAEPDLNIDVDLGPGSVIATFGNEKLRPIEMPRLSDAFQQFKASRVANIEQVSFSYASLAGITMERLSGFSATQQGKLSIARTKPYELAMNRALSRLFEWIFQMLGDEWEAEERPDDMGFLLLGLTEEQDVELTPALVRSVGMVDAAIAPMIPTEKESDIALVLQLHTSGLMPQRAAIEELSKFYDSMRDPKTVMQQINWDNVVRSNPQIQLQVGQAYAQQQGLLPGPEEQPPAPPPVDPLMAGQPGQPQSPASMGAPIDPQMMAAAAASGQAPPAAGAEELPPEVLAMIMSGMGQNG